MHVNTDQLIRDMAAIVGATRPRTEAARAERDRIMALYAQLYACPVRKINVSSRRWQDSNGNTSFTSSVSWLIHGDENWHGFKHGGYGYGSHHEWVSKQALVERGIFNGTEQQYSHASLSLMCHALNIEYTCDVTDVDRKRDLHKL